MKVIIGSRVPPRVSMFDQRDWNGSYSRAMPPIHGDASLIQSALLNRIPRRRPHVWPAVVIGLAVLIGLVLA